ncbi:hypothetical protein GCM10009814_34500 [Lapillicoccus jejuensis]
MRLLSIPARHPYVDAVRPVDALAVRPRRTTGWEPDPALEPDGVGGEDGWGALTDVVHLHFGYDHCDAATLRAWTDAVHRAGVALVVTVHDLRNPHHDEPAAHDAALGVLVPAADAVLTLTPGAAAEIRARFGREATVVPHPALADPRRTEHVLTEVGLVLVPLKSLRRNVADPVEVLEAVAAGAARSGGRVRADLHPGVERDPRLQGLADLVRRAPVDVVRHERYDDDRLEAVVRRAHATVLPYRWGTHSGWLELARDLGTRVVAPSGGHHRDQSPDVLTYRYDEAHGLDAGSLADAVALACAQPPPPPLDPAWRDEQREWLRDQHARLYTRARAAARGAR